MSESLKIALTAAATLLGGLILFGLERCFLEPLNAQMATISRIGYLLVYHAERYANPLVTPALAPDQFGEWMKLPDIAAYQEAKVDLRKSAAELFATTTQIRAYWL
jgi:hypothetical protein